MPRWTHASPAGGLGIDVQRHHWTGTIAAELFASAVVDPRTGRRFATRNGIAFEAKPTADGSWHGYPVPWESVPHRIKADWQAAGAVTRRALKAFASFGRDDIHWALQADLR